MCMVINLAFRELEELIVYKAIHGMVVDYLKKRAANKVYVMKEELAMILSAKLDEVENDDVLVSVPADLVREMEAKKASVLAAKRYVDFGIYGNYIDSDAIFCIFGVEIKEKYAETEVHKEDE